MGSGIAGGATVSSSGAGSSFGDGVSSVALIESKVFGTVVSDIPTGEGGPEDNKVGCGGLAGVTS